MKTENGDNPNLYRSVKIVSLGNRRRGKHHGLIGGIMRELKILQGGSALAVPLADVGGLELGNLRSAVHRAAAAEDLAIQTQSDEKTFYVWITENVDGKETGSKKS
jgi:hypothetical protein